MTCGDVVRCVGALSPRTRSISLASSATDQENLDVSVVALEAARAVLSGDRRQDAAGGYWLDGVPRCQVHVARGDGGRRAAVLVREAAADAPPNGSIIFKLNRRSKFSLGSLSAWLTLRL